MTDLGRSWAGIGRTRRSILGRGTGHRLWGNTREPLEWNRTESCCRGSEPRFQKKTLIVLVACVQTCILSLALTGCDDGSTGPSGLASDANAIASHDAKAWNSGLSGVDPAANADGTPPYFPFLLRQPNCSLTRTVIDSTKTVVLQEANYQDSLHNYAQVPTTPDKFANGCQYPTTGIASQSGAAVGKLANGNAVVAIESGDGVTVFIVSSTGTIVSSQDYSTSYNQASVGYGISSADLNGDGIQDMVVASETGATTGTLSVFLGKADGTFTAGQIVSLTVPALANPPLGVTIDDVNGDGTLDLIAVTASDGTSAGVSVFLGKGDGTFGAVIPGPAGSGGQVVVTSDFNGDKKKDIATSYGQILLGKGDGTFNLVSQVLPEGQSAGVAAADFNHDGNVDLAFTNFNATTIDVFDGNGNGTFNYSASYPTINAALNIQTSDLDGDGYPDLFEGTAHNGVYTFDHYTQSMFHSVLNYGDGTFGKFRAYFPGSLSAVSLPSARNLLYAVADFNGDAKPDLLEVAANANATAAQFSVFPGKGDGTFQLATTNTQLSNPAAPQFVAAIAAADVNGDGDNDIVFAWAAGQSGGSPTISVALGKGNGTFQAQHDYSVPNTVIRSGFSVGNSLVLADVNGDKKLDIVFLTGGSAVANTDSALYVMLNNGDGTFATPKLVDSQPYMNYLAVADVNGDGLSDIAVNVEASATTSGSALFYLAQAGGAFKPAVTLNPGSPSPAVAAIADMNADGKPDLIFAGTTNTSTGAGNVTVLLGNGDGTFQAGISTASQEYPQGIAIADINLDGKPDVVLGGSPNMYVMDGNGDGTFNTTTAGNIYLGVSASDLQITDLTGAALPDLLFISAGNGSALSVEVFVGAQPYVAALAATTTTLQASSASITAGQSVTFTATVAGSSGSTGVPTGTVTFLNGTTTLGTGTLNGSGVATYTTMALGAGTNSITAAYGGDSNFAASTSTAVTVTVQAVPPSFTVSASPTSLSITAGGAGTTTISVTPAEASRKR